MTESRTDGWEPPCECGAGKIREVSGEKPGIAREVESRQKNKKERYKERVRGKEAGKKQGPG